MSLSKSFAACTLTPSVKGKNGMPPSVKSSSSGTFTATSFFIDSSGHSNFTLPLELKFASQEDLDIALASKTIVPAPSNIVAEEETEQEESEPAKEADQEEASGTESSFIGFEAHSYSMPGSSKAVVVEAIKINTTSVKDLVVSFETEITVRASDYERPSKKSPDESSSIISSIKANLEITPVLTIKKEAKPGGASAMDIPDVMALELGAIPDHMQKESSARVHETRLDPVSVEVTLTHAFTISVESVRGPTPGKTMVSLTIKHSNLHREVVTISNIAFHPGHSRYEHVSNSSPRHFGSKYSVSKLVVFLFVYEMKAFLRAA
jgi:hypothetical protein